jgi:polar amino acid transport system substrate-binding protein
MKPRSTRLVALVSAAVILAACGGSSTPSPQPIATGPASTVAPTEAATAAPTPVAQVPSNQLLVAGKLLVCSDIPYPPLEYFDSQNNPTGSDIDLATEIGNRLGLQIQVVNSVFDTIILAVTGGKCDVIVSDMNITAKRVDSIDFVPYQAFGQAFLVPTGNPGNFQAELDLCGKKVGAETGTTEVDYVQGTGDYATTGGLKKKCTDAGKAAPTMQVYQKDSDGVLALAAKSIDVYFEDTPVVAYYAQQQPSQFMVAPVPQLNSIKVGIGVPKDKTGLRDAIKAALLSMIQDGTYLKILTKYDVQNGALQASDIVVNKS